MYVHACMRAYVRAIVGYRSLVKAMYVHMHAEYIKGDRIEIEIEIELTIFVGW